MTIGGLTVSGIKPPSIARLAVAFVFFYHGLVPKLIYLHASELELVARTPTFGMDHALIVRAAGAGEVLLAIFLLTFWNKTWPLHFAAFALLGLIAATVLFAPNIMVAAFNPVSLTVTTLALVWIALQTDGAYADD